MREYTTAVERLEDPEGKSVFTLDGRELTAYMPTDGQLAMLLASFGRHVSDNTRVAGAIDFLLGVLDERSSNYITDRLMDRDHPLGLDVVTDIMRDLVEEWSGRPTQRPSDSRSSQPTGGPNSTPTTLPSTSSGSEQIVSSTASSPGVS